MSIVNVASGVPADATCFFKDGSAWCCVFGDFVNLQESPAGFGDTSDAALADLTAAMEKKAPVRKGWECHVCGFDGIDNAQYNRFCVSCKRSR